MDKVNFEDGQLVTQGYVEIDGVQHNITDSVYEGNTTLSAYNLNKMQDNIEKAINGKAGTTVATQEADGLMSKEDKSNLDILLNRGKITTSVEFETGRIIDNKKEYAMIVDFGNLPNSENKGVDCDLGNLKFTKIYGIAYYLNNYISLPNANIELRIEGSWVNIKTTTDMSSYTAEVTLCYTKN